MAGEARHAPVVLLRSSAGEMALTLQDRLLSFEYEDSDGKADRVRLSLRNDDLVLFDDGAIAPGAALLVSWGYPDALSVPRSVVLGRARGGKGRGSAKGFTTLNVEARAGAVALDRLPRTRAWRAMTRAAVVRAIAGEYGFGTPDVEDSAVVLDTVSQASETDAQFLRRLADAEGFVFYLDESGLHWHQRRLDRKPDFALSWGAGDIIDLSFDHNLWSAPASVTARAVDPERGLGIEAIGRDGASGALAALEGDLSVLAPDGPGASGGLVWDEASLAFVPVPAATAADGVPPIPGGPSGGSMLGALAGVWPFGRGDAVTVPGAPQQAPAERRARAMYREQAQRRFAVKVTIVGNPHVRAKSVVELRDVGPLLAGLYYVRGATHRIGPDGYVTTLDMMRGNARRSASPLVGRTAEPVNRNEAPAAGGPAADQGAAFGWGDADVEEILALDADGLAVRKYTTR